MGVDPSSADTTLDRRSVLGITAGYGVTPGSKPSGQEWTTVTKRCRGHCKRQWEKKDRVSPRRRKRSFDGKDWLTSLLLTFSDSLGRVVGCCLKGTAVHER
jgi:hypothetical protein